MVKQQINELPDFNEFYVSSTLYTDYNVKQEEKDKVFKTVFNNTPIDCYCIDCSANSVFVPDDNRPHRSHGHGMTFPITSSNEWNVNLLTNYSIYQKEYTCSRDPNHKLIFFLQLKKGKLSKIGQAPALADIAEQDIRKYKKVLGDKHYHEFSKAIGLFAHGVGVGSFVYLRRIIENFVIKTAYELAKARAGWDDNEYQKSRVKEKIELLKTDLPEFLVNNPVIYSIISKGIHELTENECREYFPVLKTCLEFVLTDLEAKRETEQKRKDMQATLGKIAGPKK
jgi:hypothetical protein